MAVFNSSFITQPFNISVVTSNGTDQLKTLVAPSWVGAPNVRGTMDILRSCVLTLVACIYTALHLDVPRKTTWQYLLREKSIWVLITLFAPEIAVYMAASQLRYALKLRSSLRKIREELKASGMAPNEAFEIDLKYCYFIAMGAVRFQVTSMFSLPDLSSRYHKYFSHAGTGRRPVQFSVRPGPAAIIHLAKKNHWIEIQPENIDDKSKANTIQKALVLVQVIWMVTQCIARRIYNLPLSLLEIHTVVHVVCAVFLYACWFEKPLNVQEATLVDTEKFRNELAVMLQRHFYSYMSKHMALFTPKQEQDGKSYPVDADGSPMRWIEPQAGVVMCAGDILPSGLALPRSSFWKTGVAPTSILSDEDMNESFVLTNEFLARWDAILANPHLQNLELPQETKGTEIPGSDEREELDGSKPCQKISDLQALKEFKPPRLNDWERLFWEGRHILHINAQVDEGRKISNQTNSVSRPDLTTWSWHLSILGITLSGLYGGVHLTVWGQAFPSYVEEVMWKVSCLLIISFLPALIILVYFIGGFLSLFEPLKTRCSWVNDHTMYIAIVVLMSPSLVVFFGYVLARAYIILESFLSLRQTPVGVYITPEWVELFPHF